MIRFKQLLEKMRTDPREEAIRMGDRIDRQGVTPERSAALQAAQDLTTPGAKIRSTHATLTAPGSKTKEIYMKTRDRLKRSNPGLQTPDV